jgi:hypothetical protein
MSLEMKYEPDGIYALRISGILKRSEFSAEQKALARKIDSGSKPRLLVILENFEGWERGADWGNDLDFLFLHSGKISKIAIVAEPRWETTVARRLSLSSLTNWSRRGAGWRNKPPL